MTVSSTWEVSMDNRDLIASLKTVRLKVISVCDALGDQNVNLAFLGAVEAENRLDFILREIQDEIEKLEGPIDPEEPGQCSECPSKEAHWTVDPYMLDLFDETCYLFLCYKCYQDRLDEI